ncbi:MAG: hypothetical protein KKA60_05810 [Proteobacteria bacterium]|nr:hypothetical protein [Pseudomonadota bacterium]
MNKPPILNFSCSRETTSQGKPFFYDAKLNLNLIEYNGNTVPFVDVPLMPNSELYTKTEAERERDEDSIELVELLTKTLVKREEDDNDYRLLELLTKTRVERERDDE